ncbi:DUF3761 domain-containing protein [Deinococcus sp. UYEF24]
MKTVKQFIALLALLLSAASALQATTSSNANLRASPSTSSRVLTVIPKGAALNPQNCTTWCSVRYGGQTGYVSKSTLSFNGPAPVPARLPPTSGTYTNVDGQQIQRPVMSDTAPAGASAHCRDGSYSFSTHRSGTCSHHGGVGQWL